MVYQRISKRYSRNSQIQKKDVASNVPKIPVQASSDSASPQNQEMPSYTPLAADWVTNNNLMKNLLGRQVVQPQKESSQQNIQPIQAKLTIGEVGDKYEQEADKIARQVVSQINTPASVKSASNQSLQREEIPEEDELQMKSASGMIQREEMPQEDEEEIQMKSESGMIQREEMPQEDEEEIQMKSIVQRKSNGTEKEAKPDLEASIQQAKGGGQPLTDNIREPMEKAFGADFSGVNIHTDAQSDQLNQSIQAKAFTTGQDIFFRQGAYNPGSRGGQELIAHELTHVVQQSGEVVHRKLQHSKNPVVTNQQIQVATNPDVTIQCKRIDVSEGQKRILLKKDPPVFLRDCVADLFWKEIFYAWGLANNITEEIAFRQNVDQFENKPDYLLGKHIYDTYIDPDGANPINISSALRKPLKAIFASTDNSVQDKKSKRQGIVLTQAINKDIFKEVVDDCNTQTGSQLYKDVFRKDMEDHIAEIREEYKQKQLKQKADAQSLKTWGVGW